MLQLLGRLVFERSVGCLETDFGTQKKSVSSPASLLGAFRSSTGSSFPDQDMVRICRVAFHRPKYCCNMLQYTKILEYVSDQKSIPYAASDATLHQEVLSDQRRTVVVVFLVALAQNADFIIRNTMEKLNSREKRHVQKGKRLSDMPSQRTIHLRRRPQPTKGSNGWVTKLPICQGTKDPLAVLRMSKPQTFWRKA